MNHEQQCNQLLEVLCNLSHELECIILDLNVRSAALRQIGYGEG
ncbi:hypothetical protein [Klebsiella phage BUCT_49532]|nr:hypothetical protein PQZ56_gp78 [Klebsiella phage BUCT_49532]WCI99772.1 hypothetical protein [Klebsiella phage BUCT_49532]